MKKCCRDLRNKYFASTVLGGKTEQWKNLDTWRTG